MSIIVEETASSKPGEKGEVEVEVLSADSECPEVAIYDGPVLVQILRYQAAQPYVSQVSD